jgi:hypothetical protein
LQEASAELAAAFKQHSWLNTLHLDVGSQGLYLATTMAGVKAVCLLHFMQVASADLLAACKDNCCPNMLHCRDSTAANFMCSLCVLAGGAL